MFIEANQVKSSPPTNQLPALYRPNALPVVQPTVSQHWRATPFIYACICEINLKVGNIPGIQCCSCQSPTTRLANGQQKINYISGHSCLAWNMAWTVYGCFPKFHMPIEDIISTDIKGSTTENTTVNDRYLQFLYTIHNWMAPWKNRISRYISFFRPSLNHVLLFPMFCLLVKGEYQILVF